MTQVSNIITLGIGGSDATIGHFLTSGLGIYTNGPTDWIGLTLYARSNDLTIDARTAAFTMLSRTDGLTVHARTDDLTLDNRSAGLTVETRE